MYPAVTLLLIYSALHTSTVNAETYHGIFWNLESVESSDGLIAKHIAQKQDIVFCGLSEVSDQM